MSDPIHPAQFLFTDDHPLTSQLNLEFTAQVNGETTIYIEAPKIFADEADNKLHQGFSTILLDTAMGACALAELKIPTAIATIKLMTNHLRQPIVGEKLECVATHISQHNEVSYQSGEIRSMDQGDVIASAIGTFMVGTSMTPAR